MIAARVLGLGACAFVAACASPQRNEFVARVPVSASLVLGAGASDGSAFAAREDARLGAVSNAERRVADDAFVVIYDRQQSLDGRPYNNYRSVTRTIERLTRDGGGMR